MRTTKKIVKLLKLGMLLLGISTMIVSCKDEEPIPFGIQNLINIQDSKSRFVSEDDIPLVMKYLGEKSHHLLRHASKQTSKNNADIEFDEIIEVIDTLEKRNYTFNITNIKQYEEGELSLYNLIVSTDSLGEVKTPYVLKYTLENDFAKDYIKGTKLFNEFKGKVVMYSLESFLSNHTSFSSKDVDCPDETIFDNSNATGTTGSSDSTGNFSGPGGSSCGWVATGRYFPCGCGGNADGHGPSGAPCCAGSVAITTYECNFNSKTVGDNGCPEPTNGDVAVLFDINYTQVLLTELDVLLTQEELDYIATELDGELTHELAIFLADNDHSNEAKDVAAGVIELLVDFDSFEKTIESPAFDSLEDPWLDILREYARRLNDFKDRISEQTWKALNRNLDYLLQRALTKTAFKLNMDADIDQENEKQLIFQTDGKKGVGILLYEFANGLGPETRDFHDGDFYNQYFDGNRIEQIKADFEFRLIEKQLTFDQFVSNGNSITGGNAFSPDHAGVVDSFNQHLNANWVQFFVGGTTIYYTPSNQFGYIDVRIYNPTSRNSLLLHIGDNYDRDEFGSIPLSTIKQYFYIRIKVR